MYGVEKGREMKGTTLKFKVGDKVRILPSAVDVHVTQDEVGKTGAIISSDSEGEHVVVLMDKPRKKSGYRIDWCVDSSQIELALVPGQQLLLWNDIWNDVQEKEV